MADPSPNPFAPLTWKWCVSCQRCYQRPAGAEPTVRCRCPYPDCDGAPIVCEYPWERIARRERSFPAVPRRGVRYRVYS